MKGPTRAALLTLGVTLVGCGAGSPPPSADVGPRAPAAASAMPVEPDTVRSYKREVEAQAMRGLLYAGGRVAIDAAAASQIVAFTDAEESRLEVERGHGLLATNHRLEAIEAMTRAVLLAPDSAAAYEGLGRALTNKRKYPEAAAAFRTGLELDPGSASLHFEMGETLVRMDDRSGGIEELREAARLEPGNAKTHERLAIQLYYTNDPASSWRHVRAAESLGHVVPPQFRALLVDQMAEPSVEEAR